MAERSRCVENEEMSLLHTTAVPKLYTPVKISSPVTVYSS